MKRIGYVSVEFIQWTIICGGREELNESLGLLIGLIVLRKGLGEALRQRIKSSCFIIAVIVDLSVCMCVCVYSSLFFQFYRIGYLFTLD